MLEIAICEDGQADRECLQGMLHTIQDKYNLERQIACYCSGEYCREAVNTVHAFAYMEKPRELKTFGAKYRFFRNIYNLQQKNRTCIVKAAFTK